MKEFHEYNEEEKETQRISWIVEAIRKASHDNAHVMHSAIEALKEAVDGMKNGLAGRMEAFTAATKEASQGSNLVGRALFVAGLGAWALFSLEIGKIWFDASWDKSLSLTVFSVAVVVLVFCLAFPWKDHFRKSSIGLQKDKAEQKSPDNQGQ